MVIHNGYLHISKRRTLRLHSAILRTKVQTGSTRFEIDNSSWKVFHEINAAPADVLCVVIVNGSIYSGRSDGKIWKCSVVRVHSCKDFHDFRKSHQRVSEIQYNPKNDTTYAVRSINHIGESWSHHFWLCRPDIRQSCSELSTGFNGWATFEVAFDAFWITDAGLIWKCPFNEDHCFKFNDLKKMDYIKVVASKKYLYVRLESSGFIWRCDPNVINSCSRAFEPSDIDKMGPFIFV